MAKRKSVRTYKTDEVQGEGSQVIVTGVKVKEIRAARRAAREAGEDFDDFEAGIALLAKHIVGWNWVDDHGNPLPTPKESPEVIGELTNEESEFLVNLLLGKPKN